MCLFSSTTNIFIMSRDASPTDLHLEQEMVLLLWCNAIRRHDGEPTLEAASGGGLRAGLWLTSQILNHSASFLA